MARPIWKGAVSFGMVSIPVKLYGATESKDVSFNLLHAGCGTRIKQQRYCPEDETVIEWGDVIRGYEYSKDQYVPFTEQDFESVPVRTTKTVDIDRFVDPAEIDPQYYERSYFLEPEDIGAKPYALLRHALEASGKVAIAKVAIRQKEQLCLLRPQDTGLGLVLITMFWPDELRSSADLALPDDSILSAGEQNMALALVEALTATFESELYHDEYREALLDMVQTKVEGGEIKALPAPAVSPVIDLMAALAASVEAAKRTA